MSTSSGDRPRCQATRPDGSKIDCRISPVDDAGMCPRHSQEAEWVMRRKLQSRDAARSSHAAVPSSLRRQLRKLEALKKTGEEVPECLLRPSFADRASRLAFREALASAIVHGLVGERTGDALRAICRDQAAEDGQLDVDAKGEIKVSWLDEPDRPKALVIIRSDGPPKPPPLELVEPAVEISNGIAVIRRQGTPLPFGSITPEEG